MGRTVKAPTLHELTGFTSTFSPSREVEPMQRSFSSAQYTLSSRKSKARLTGQLRSRLTITFLFEPSIPALSI